MTTREASLKALRDAAQLQQPQEPSKKGKARLRKVCPHCNGAGKVPLDPKKVLLGPKSDQLVKCSGCDGKGYR
jgi:DnaJ-class molecular chaperone